jgi:hypothetical protein
MMMREDKKQGQNSYKRFKGKEEKASMRKKDKTGK